MQILRTIEPPKQLATAKDSPAPCANYVDIPLSRRCVNRCVFCYSNSDPKGPTVTTQSILRSLAKERRRGVGWVHFVGGEPTLHPQLVDILKHAKAMGYKTVIVSNGFGFTSSSFTGLALPYIDELIFSLHGHNADTHGRMTGNPVSFRRLMRAFENVSRENSTVGLSVNTTVTRWNLGSLLPISGMIRRFGVRKYHCLNAIPLGRGRARFLDLSPSLQKCSATLPKLAQKCWQNNIQLLVAGFPCCVLGPYHRCSVDWSGEYVRDHVQPGKIVFEKEPGEPKNFRIDLGRIKIAKCRPCALGKVCGGISAEYYNTYGDDELSPFIVD